MSKKAQDNLFCIALLLVFGGFLILTLQLGSSRARMVPLPITVISMLLLLLQLFFQNFRPDVKLNVDSVDLFRIQEDTLEAEEEAETYAKKARENAHSELNAFGVVLLMFAMVILLGILEASFLFIVGYFVLVGKEKIHTAVIWSAVTNAALYVMFIRLINLHPWEGLIRITFFS